MDEHTLPTADELGVSQEEYAKILRDLRQRGLGGEPVAFAAEMTQVVVPDDPRTALLAPRQAAPDPARGRLRAWGPLIVSMAAVLAIVGGRSLLSIGDPAPAYAFLESANGHPVTYSSCKPVQVAVYPANGPSNAVELVKEAAEVMRGATGLDIVVVGPFGGHAPNWNFKAAPIRPDDPVAVSWQDGNAIAALTDDVAGLGGSFVIEGANGNEHLASGTIALSRDEYDRLDRAGDHGEEVAILLHEFGHVFGLAHVNSPGELMYVHNIGRTTLGPGDREGLRLAGQGPCV
ncbi:matrixin family metalloprotease [Nocardioides marmorisolisilvae]|uniref:Peptidase M10 metallopeptidase domain-containing protein n=1 Tax=Nocardioides marmorisolisilvae TaxID=1542737 RepID=A0A3N0DU27_9ACTN|nr:matrixin family metalloprotease [Nocardioides marmorisolisilvae]RNL79100.1 hypothetical protein EFL95_08670 [Nocardioides marmorisolisilvae]